MDKIEMRTKIVDIVKDYAEGNYHLDITEENLKIAAEEIVKFLAIPVAMPRYFIDERAGCAAVRDREHPKYDKDYPGLHYDTPDVVEYKHGRTEGGRWIVELEDLEYLQKLCKDLNGCYKI